MHYVYLERLDPTTLRKAKEFGSKEKDVQWLIPYPVYEEWPSELPTPQVIHDIYKTLERKTWPALQYIQELFRSHASKDLNDQTVITAMSKGVAFTHMEVARTMALLEHLNADDSIDVFTRWPSTHRLLNMNGIGKNVRAIPTQMKFRSTLSLIKTILKNWIYVGKCLCARFSPTRGNFTGKAKIVVAAQYGTPLEVMIPIFKYFKAEEIFFHLYRIESLSKEYRRKLNSLEESLNKMHWGWWEYQDRNFLRAFKFALVHSLRTILALFSAMNRDVRTFALRTEQQCAQWKWELEDVLQSQKPEQMLVQDERNPLGIVTAQVARTENCKTINLFSGWVIPDEPFLSPPPPFDFWIVWSEFQKRLFKKAGVPSSKIFVGGHLNEERWLVLKNRRTFEIGEEVKTIVYFSHPRMDVIPDLRPTFHAMLTEVLDTFPNVSLVVKAHPSEQDGITSTLFSTLPRTTIADIFSDPHDCILKADVVIAAGSTTIIEALVAGVPCAVYDLTICFAELIRHGAILDLTFDPNPISSLENFIGSRNQRMESISKANEILGDQIGALDGKALNQIAKCLTTKFREVE